MNLKLKLLSSVLILGMSALTFAAQEEQVIENTAVEILNEEKEANVEILSVIEPVVTKVDHKFELLKSDIGNLLPNVLLLIAPSLDGQFLKNFRLALGRKNNTEQARNYFISRLIPYNQTSFLDATLESPLAFCDIKNLVKVMQTTYQHQWGSLFNGKESFGMNHELYDFSMLVPYPQALRISETYYINIFSLFNTKTITTSVFDAYKFYESLNCMYKDVALNMINSGLGTHKNNFFIFLNETPNDTMEIRELRFIYNWTNSDALKKGDSTMAAVPYALCFGPDRLRFLTRQMLKFSVMNTTTLEWLIKKTLETNTIENRILAHVMTEEIVLNYIEKKYDDKFVRPWETALIDQYEKIIEAYQFIEDDESALTYVHKILPLVLKRTAQNLPTMTMFLNRGQKLIEKAIAQIQGEEYINAFDSLMNARLYNRNVLRSTLPDPMAMATFKLGVVPYYEGIILEKLGKTAEALVKFKDGIPTITNHVIFPKITQDDLEWIRRTLPLSFNENALYHLDHKNNDLADQYLQLIAGYGVNPELITTLLSQGQIFIDNAIYLHQKEENTTAFEILEKARIYYTNVLLSKLPVPVTIATYKLGVVLYHEGVILETMGQTVKALAKFKEAIPALKGYLAYVDISAEDKDWIRSDFPLYLNENALKCQYELKDLELAAQYVQLVADYEVSPDLQKAAASQLKRLTAKK